MSQLRVMVNGKPDWKPEGPARARPVGHGGVSLGFFSQVVLTHAQRKARGTATEEAAAKHRRSV